MLKIYYEFLNNDERGAIVSTISLKKPSSKILAFLLLFATFIMVQAVNAHACELCNEYEIDLTCESRQFVVTASSLNFRVGPATSYSSIRRLPGNTLVTVINFVPDGWSYVQAGEETGYVFTNYITNRINIPTPTGDVSRSTTRSNVEVLHWDEVRALMPIHSIIQVYDVRTGLTYYVRMFANGRHADVETIDTHNTDILRATYGGVWSWDARPVIVTWPAVEGRYFAAAIHGMPHDVSTIANNGKNGHICIHFLGVVNRNPTWGATMQAAMWEAYNSQQ